MERKCQTNPAEHTPYGEQVTGYWMSCLCMYVCTCTHLAGGEGRSFETSTDKSRALIHPHHFDRDFKSSDILLQWSLEEIWNIQMNTHMNEKGNNSRVFRNTHILYNLGTDPKSNEQTEQCWEFSAALSAYWFEFETMYLFSERLY